MINLTAKIDIPPIIYHWCGINSDNFGLHFAKKLICKAEPNTITVHMINTISPKYRLKAIQVLCKANLEKAKDLWYTVPDNSWSWKISLIFGSILSGSYSEILHSNKKKWHKEFYLKSWHIQIKSMEEIIKDTHFTNFVLGRLTLIREDAKPNYEAFLKWLGRTGEEYEQIIQKIKIVIRNTPLLPDLANIVQSYS